MTSPHSHVNSLLIAHVDHLYTRAMGGDKNAEEAIHDIHARAMSGDESAVVGLNTLAVVHYEKLHPEEWKEAEHAYQRIMKQEPEAVAWAKTVSASAARGDVGSQRLADMLQAHDNKYTASAWAIPEASGLDENTRVRNIPAMNIGRPPLPHFTANPTTSEHTHHSHRATLGETRPSLADENRMSVGAVSPPQKHFLQMTPEIEKRLVTLMLSGIVITQAPSLSSATRVAQGIQSGSSRAGQALQHVIIEPPICQRARDAITRNSPSAPALVDACNKAAGHQILAPMTAIVVPLGAEGTVAPLALGRLQLRRG